MVVVGAGHAGIEAALACARLGLSTACVTMRLDRIGHLPCNCSIGGPAKGHIAREVDALGGQMAVTADHALTHIRRVGTGRGASVQTVRAHVCKELYPRLMQETLLRHPGLTLIEATVETISYAHGLVTGVNLKSGEQLCARAVVLTTGTFLNGLCHEGMKKTVAARHGDEAALTLSDFLRSIGVRMRRFKTGTTPRVRYSSLNLAETTVMESEPEAGAISFLHDRPLPEREPLPCWQTRTNPTMHDLVRERLHESAMYGGQIEGIGPRYCPSIEDKVMRFAEKQSHPIFLEIEDWGMDSVYLQGVSTSLPADVQLAMLHEVAGMRSAEMIRPGYAVEYDMADPLQLTPHLMSKQLSGLFLAGQVNGTSGYEEAAGQGIVAGINAARWATGNPPVDFHRDRSFIGVMIDDLVTKGVDDPYRMLTARAEHRLLLRHDNADVRLTPLSKEIGLCSDARWARFSCKREKILSGLDSLRTATVSPGDGEAFDRMNIVLPKTRTSLFELMRRPEMTLDRALEVASACGLEVQIDPSGEVREQIELAGLYDGYLEREQRLSRRTRKLEEFRIPVAFDFEAIKGLSHESKDKLSKIRPTTVGQASRVPGVRPTDIALIIGHLKARR